MSPIPEFELGLWNAWILALPLIGNCFFQVRVTSNREREVKPSLEYINRKERKLLPILQIVVFVSFIYPTFLPLEMGTLWFYVGSLIFLLGFVYSTLAILNFATTPKDEPVTHGAYRISRNPMYVGWYLMYIGIGIACISWVYLLLTMVLMTLHNIMIASEERWCLEEYGDAYREYMDRTPRWLGMPKPGKGNKGNN